MLVRHAIVAGVLAAIAVSFATPASAELLTPTGGKGQLVLEQVAGFRAGGAAGPDSSGLSYAGFLGFNYSKYSQDDNTGGGYTAYRYTSFWIAPSADFFVIDHLSIGGLIEVSTTSSVRDRKDNANAGVSSTDQPTTTNFTILPRVGWMFGIGDRFGIWPRVGAGFASRQTAIDPNTKTTFSGFILDADVSFILRVNETFFVNLTPEFSFLPGSASVTNGPNTLSVSASYMSFSVLGGIGVIL